MKTVLSVKGITKRFGSNVANRDISFDLKEGEVHTLLGENGAGKSTLMNIIYGVYAADEGEIEVNGQKVEINSPRDAIDLGIGMVHQHFMLIPRFTVAENIVLGMEKKLRIDMKKVEEDIKAASEKYGLATEPHKLISDLSVGEQQRVEILKVLYKGARVLILDEPTAVLTPQETDELFVILNRLKADGVSIIFISHKLNEVMTISDRISILRRGEIKGEFTDVASCTAQSLASAMVGKQVSLAIDKPEKEAGDVIVSLKDLCVSDETKKEVIHKFNLDIRAGEIVGLAGVDGNGQSELIKGITGAMTITGGSMEMKGKNMNGCKPIDFIKNGLGHIPEDRHGQGLVLSMSVEDNLFLETIQNDPYTKKHILRRKKIGAKAQELRENYDIRCQSLDMDVAGLSGGNQQKVIVARILDQNPDFLIAMHPTRGLDIGATKFVHECILKAREENCAVLLVSAELDDILELSDRIAVIYEGECMGVVKREDTTKEKVGLMMAGVREDK